MTALLPLGFLFLAISYAHADAPVMPNEMEIQIRGQFKGRMPLKRIDAPVTMNLEKVQDFPEDPTQKILLEPLGVSPDAGFNTSVEIKGHTPFWPGLPSITTPPYLVMPAPRVPAKSIASWTFEILNPAGATVYREESTDPLPAMLAWDGEDSEKKTAIVDTLYSARVTLIGRDAQSTVIPGESVSLPMLAHDFVGGRTIEVSLTRLFRKDSPDLSPEGMILLNKVAEFMRERAETTAHLHVADHDPTRGGERELALAKALAGTLHLSEGFIAHDHSLKAEHRGEIDSFMFNTEGEAE